MILQIDWSLVRWLYDTAFENLVPLFWFAERSAEAINRDTMA
jgi:hypothetical protein